MLATGLSIAAPSKDLLSEINVIRASGCEQQPGTSTALIRSATLDKVAKLWSAGGHLSDALNAAKYLSRTSTAKHFGGIENNRETLIILRAEYCATLADPEFREIGIFATSKRVWFVLASPTVLPTENESATIEQRIIDLVNAARSEPRRCGSQQFQPAAPLSASSLLTHAAQAHSDDLATQDRVQHRGSDGSKPSQRVTDVGYAWRAVGENIARDAFDADSVVHAWLNSAKHCRNIMSRNFSEMGVAFTTDRQQQTHVYWVQVFAAPLSIESPALRNRTK